MGVLMKVTFWRVVAVASVLLCAVTAAGSWFLRSGYVHTEDRNGDGRPDLWRFYDAAGQLRRTLTDTNFDGTSDTDEYYERGVISRRLVDRNFDQRADRDDEFDPITHERVRSIVDVDFDGSADLLVLFQDGKAVLTKWSADLPPAATHANAVSGVPAPDDTQALAPMVDPFRGTTAFHAVHTIASPDLTVGPTSTGGLPVAPVRAGPPVTTPTVGRTNSTWFASIPLIPSPPRGPPSFFLS
jgi:hypothetical protein